MWDKNGMLRIGSYHRGDDEWRWYLANAHSPGVRTPVSMDQEPDEHVVGHDDADPAPAAGGAARPAEEGGAADEDHAGEAKMDDAKPNAEGGKRQREEGDKENVGAQERPKRRHLQLNKTV